MTSQCGRTSKKILIPFYNLSFQTDPEVLSDLPSFVSFKSSLYREKLKVHRTYKTTAGKATLDGNYTETVDGRDFLALDVESPQGSIICFATEEGLSRLSSAQELLFDGAASTCPSAGSVYLTTSVAVKGENVIVGYFLLPGGTKTIYALALSELLNCIEELSLPRPNPSYVRSDFDPALVQALGQVFPAAKHRGCHFQFAQEVWRYVQRLGLAKHYNDDKAVREFVKKTVALAFLPSSFVHVAWRQLKDEVSVIDTLEGFVDYFETTWILGDYDVSQWNQHGNRGCLTSHRKELLHRKMSQVIGASRPDILKFAVVAKQDEADTRAAISELGSGTPQRKGGKKVDKTESDLERYEEGLATGQLTIAEFLRACSRMCGI